MLAGRSARAALALASSLRVCSTFCVLWRNFPSFKRLASCSPGKDLLPQHRRPVAVKFVSVLRRLLVFSSFPSLTVSCPGTPQVRRTPAVRREYMTLAGLEGIPQVYYFGQQPPQRPRHRPPRAPTSRSFSTCATASSPSKHFCTFSICIHCSSICQTMRSYLVLSVDPERTCAPTVSTEM